MEIHNVYGTKEIVTWFVNDLHFGKYYMIIISRICKLRAKKSTLNFQMWKVFQRLQNLFEINFMKTFKFEFNSLYKV